MVLQSNPLSLTVPDRAFETWLRDTGYLELLDHRTTQLHKLQSNATESPTPSLTPPASPATSIYLLVSHVATLVSVLTVNPFAKLTAADFGGDTVSWTHGFVGGFGSYSYPADVSQGRLRVHENLRRYARNYATLFVLFFACSLYQMPFALVGLVSSLALWEGFRFCDDRWGLDQRPFIRQSLVRIAQCGTAIILFFSNVQMAFFCAIAVCYTAMIFHASFRKLTPANKPARSRR